MMRRFDVCLKCSLLETEWSTESQALLYKCRIDYNCRINFMTFIRGAHNRFEFGRLKLPDECKYNFEQNILTQDFEKIQFSGINYL